MVNYSKEEKKRFRTLLFRHQDGLAISNTVAVLDRCQIFDYFKNRKIVTLNDLIAAYPKLNAAYLNIALRSLASQGFFTYSLNATQIRFETTNKFKALLEHVHHYVAFASAYPLHLSMLEQKDFRQFSLDNALLQLSRDFLRLKHENNQDGFYNEEVLIHLEGVLLLPVLVYLNFYKDTEGLSIVQFLTNDTRLNEFLENLSLLKDGHFTPKGQYLFDKSYAYGVTTSYLPIMRNLDDYLNGRFERYFQRDHNGNEQHVFRSINVWGSGGSHSTYFKKIDEVLLDLFNRPLDQQPKGIIDVGCGNGALLEHIFNLIWNHTNRRDDLDKNKLILIGADYNKEALLSTQKNLKKADVWAEVVWGDIGNPAEINQKLEQHYQVKLEDLLNIRSFLDHNRPFNQPVQTKYPESNSTGAFAHRGALLNNGAVEQSLVEHFLKWKPYVQKHGLLLIELHTLDPNLVQLNLGKTPCTAYDVTHGFSDQYIVEVEVFNQAIERAGLSINKAHNYKYPNSELSTVTINLIS